ncbi:MAG: hypothetical protein ACK413_02875 [Patescibacteria group bacterium]
MDLSAKITGIKYRPFLCRKLNIYTINNFEEALSKDATFILNIDNTNQIAISWWVSPKRTRSYPYARVYDSLAFSGRKVTIIPIMKDEGIEGDRDFLQWDTISLMSLLGIYVIVAYYVNAKPSLKKQYKTTKITKQEFDVSHIKKELESLLSYQSDALHWNLSQIEKVGELLEKALKFYDIISKKLKIKMHSKERAKKRIEELLKGKEEFMRLSRDLAKRAQWRESVTTQPKEKLDGKKGRITIRNYLGGCYYLTLDEYKIKQRKIYLIESKHTKRNNFPSLGDIKDGLLKMVLFTNLEDVKIDDKKYKSIPVLKLTTEKGFKKETLNKTQINFFNLLKKEAMTNKFKLLIK